MDFTIKCTILTPERVFFEGQVEYVNLEAHDGGRGFLPRHAAFVSALGIGLVKIRQTGTDTFYLIEGGFVEMNRNKLILIAENALSREDVSQDETEAHLAELSLQPVPVNAVERMAYLREVKKWQARKRLVDESAHLPKI